MQREIIFNTMSKERDNPKTIGKNATRVIKDPKTGLKFLSGPKITKMKVERDFPFDSDRDAIVIRRSVGL